MTVYVALLNSATSFTLYTDMIATLKIPWLDRHPTPKMEMVNTLLMMFIYVCTHVLVYISVRMYICILFFLVVASQCCVLVSGIVYWSFFQLRIFNACGSYLITYPLFFDMNLVLRSRGIENRIYMTGNVGKDYMTMQQIKTVIETVLLRRREHFVLYMANILYPSETTELFY